MGNKILMDEHVASAITIGLLARGIDVRTVQGESMDAADDPVVLDFAASVDRVVFTNDSDFLAIACERQRRGMYFRGVVYARLKWVSIKQCVDDLELIAVAGSADEFENRVHYLPF